MTLDGVDDFDILSAVWILANNDETAIITYEGILFRLDLPSTCDIRGLIARRGELFRRTVSDSRLADWKKDMVARPNGRPSWIKYLRTEDDQLQAINSITPHDVFRSQFRTGRDAERSSVEVLNWGLQHIDRLRKARIESQDLSAKKTQVSVVMWIGIAGLVLQIAIACFNFSKTASPLPGIQEKPNKAVNPSVGSGVK